MTTRRRVTKAVIPAAGLGTRFLPATKAQPKEMIPVIDKPAIQYVVEEAVRAGIDDVLIVTGRGKRALEDHFDRAIELEVDLRAKGKEAELREVLRLSELADIHFIRQGEALGLGHAVSLARKHVGDQPFAVLLGDDIMDESSTVLEGMIALNEATGASVQALKRFPPSEISAYGCAEVEPAPEISRDDVEVVRLRGVVEKPAPEDAPSDLGMMGRYVLTPRIFDKLDEVAPGKGGEIQLTDAIDLLLAEEPVYGYPFVEGRYDIGNKLDYLRATVQLALGRDDLGPAFRSWLAGYVRAQGIVGDGS
ncbi:MAG: UTP--glucose-1-phosphate uridylyltransferase GalU [Acidimicrobiia bacterium]